MLFLHRNKEVGDDIYTKINFKNSIKNPYTKKTFRNNKTFYFKSPEETVINKFINNFFANKEIAKKYLDKSTSLNFVSEISSYENFKFLNLHKFNNVNADLKDATILLFDKNKKPTVAHIQLSYEPDLYSDYKIKNISIEQKIMFAKYYNL